MAAHASAASRISLHAPCCRPPRTTDRHRAEPHAAPARWRPTPDAPCWSRRKEWCSASALLPLLGSFRGASKTRTRNLETPGSMRRIAPEWQLSGIPDPLDFPVKLDTRIFLHPGAHGFSERLDVMRGRVSGVDQKIAMHLRHLRTAKAQ